MSDGAHLLIPFAACGGEGCAAALRELTLPNLGKLLARLDAEPAREGSEADLSPPHEHVLARETGLPAKDGRMPWAAWEVRSSGREPRDDAWAWITPCHWRVNQSDIVMDPPQRLDLSPESSQALLAAMRPYFEQDGIDLAFEEPARWLARGEVFRDLATASLDRVVGHRVDDWLPRSPEAKPIRRLQQEMQMLLYTHEVNESRLQAGLLPVNSFWVSGAGSLAGSHPAAPAGLQVVHGLRDAALLQDWGAWAVAWRQVDEREGARLLAELGQGREVRVTLCGERNARTWKGRGGGLARKLAAAFRRPRPQNWLETL